MTGEPPTTEGDPRVRRNLTLAAATAVLALAALPCRRQRHRRLQRGRELVAGRLHRQRRARSTRNPPAFLRGAQMRVGNGHGKGLVHAAERSPALRSLRPGGRRRRRRRRRSPTCETIPPMSAPLRCVFYDPEAVDAGSRLQRARLRGVRARRRRGLRARRGRGRGRARGERHDVTGEDGAIAFVMRALALTREQCIGVGAALADAPLGAVWVSPLDLEVRGAHVRVAEEGDELLYEAVISELAAAPARRQREQLVRVGQELAAAAARRPRRSASRRSRVNLALISVRSSSRLAKCTSSPSLRDVHDHAAAARAAASRSTPARGRRTRRARTRRGRSRRRARG